MKNILKIFITLLFALNVMPVSAATQQDMQKDIDALTAAFDAQIKSFQNSQNTKKDEPKPAKAGDNCDSKDINAKTARYEKTGQGTTLNCVIKKCNKGFEVSADGKTCTTKQKVGDACDHEDVNATSAKIEKNNRGEITCVIKTCKAGYDVSSNGQSCKKVIPVGKDCTAQIPNAKLAKINENGDCVVDYCNPGFRASSDDRSCIETIQAGTDCHNEKEFALVAKYNTELICIIEKCEDGYEVSSNKRYCIEKQAPAVTTQPDTTSLPESTDTQPTIVTPDKETKITTPTNNNTKTGTDYKNTQESTSTHSKPKTEKGSVSPRDDGLYYTDDFGILDANEVNIYQDGIFARAKTNVGSCSKNVQSDKKFAEYNSAGGCDNISPRIWEAYFDNGKVVGTYKCTNKLPSKNAVTYTGRTGNGYKESFRIDTPGDTPGNYCWCAATEPNSLHWVYVRLENDAYGKPQDCENSSSCVGRCASAFQKSATFRKAMFKDEP